MENARLNCTDDGEARLRLIAEREQVRRLPRDYTRHVATRLAIREGGATPANRTYITRISTDVRRGYYPATN